MCHAERSKTVLLKNKQFELCYKIHLTITFHKKRSEVQTSIGKGKKSTSICLTDHSFDSAGITAVVG